MKLHSLLLFLTAFAVAAKADPRLWDTHGATVFQNGRVEWSASVARDANGMTVTTWSDLHTGSREIYAQLINPVGQALWGSGVQLTDDPHEQSQPQVIATSDGWIVAWIDYRNVPSGHTHREEGGYLYAQKLDYDGNPLWVQGGVCIDSSFDTRVRWGFLHLVSDGSGGAMIAWATVASGYSTYVARVTGSGALAWPCMTITTSGTSPLLMDVVSDGNGGIVIVWQANSTSGLAATLVSADGTTPWGAYSRIGWWSSSAVSLASDGEGGFYAAWQGYVSPQWDHNIYAQHVNASGQPLWNADGTLICNVTGPQNNPVLAASYQGGANDGCVVVWNDARNTSRPDVYYTQKLSPSGVALWDSNGIVLCDSVRAYRNMALTSDGAGGFVAAWEDLRGIDYTNPTGGQDIGALHLNASGRRLWNGDVVPVCTGARDQLLPALVPENGAFLVLYQNGDRIAYDDSAITGFSLQRLDAVSGARQFSDSGMVVTNYSVNTPSGLCAAPMSDHRTAMFWNSNGNHYQILDQQGRRTLNSDTAIIRCDVAQLTPEITHVCADGSGGVFAILDGYTNREDAFLARIAPDGHLVNNGYAQRLLPPGDELGIYSDAVCPDGEGGCYVTVERILGESLPSDIWGNLYLTHWDANCQPLWQTPVLLDTMIDMFQPISLLPHPQGGVVMWSAGRLARISANGTVIWNADVGDSLNLWGQALIAAGQSGFYLAGTRGSDMHDEVETLRVTLDGQVPWPARVVALQPAQDFQQECSIAADNAGNLIIAWADYSHVLQSRHIFAQKLSPDGARMWGDSGRVVVFATEGQYSSQCYPAVVSDGSDGAFVAWSDYYHSSSIYATHLNADGWSGPDPYWVQNRGGCLSDSNADAGSAPLMLSSGSGEAVVVWTQDNRQSQAEDQGLYAQRIVSATLAARKENTLLPLRYTLYQNFPNPFNPTTEIRFDLPKAEHVRLRIYNSLGQLVTTLIDEQRSAGSHAVIWNGANAATGLYFCRLEAGSHMQTKKMLLMK
ncbi:MAG TPA: T9SS type A sorting domain-containing protein [bacterium]